MGPRRRHPHRGGDHPDPAADQPHQRRHRRHSTTPNEPSIDDAVAVVRRHRAAHTVPLGLPTIRPAPARCTAHDRLGGHRMTRTTTTARHPRPMLRRARPCSTHSDSAPPPARPDRARPAAADGRRDQRVRHRPRRRRSTAASSTATATCSKDPRAASRSSPPASAPARRSPEPRCRPTCSPPTNAPPGSTPASSTWNAALRGPRRARLARVRARRPRRHRRPPPADHPARTAGHRPGCSSPNATRTSPPPAPPTASSWPASTPPPHQVNPASPTCTTPVEIEMWNLGSPVRTGTTSR